MKKLTGSISLLLSLLLLISCNKITSEEQLDKASHEYNNKKYTAAIVQLKNLIRDEPLNINARLLMAKSY